MTAAPLPVGLLTVRDSQILELLASGASVTRVIEVGAYRRSWTRDHVERVLRDALATRPPAPPAVHRSPPPPPPADTTGLTRWTPPDPADRAPTAVLTPRLADVLDGLCQGLTNKAIADHLGLAEDTVKTHVKRLLAALSAHDRGHAVVLAATGQVRVLIRPRKNRRGR